MDDTMSTTDSITVTPATVGTARRSKFLLRGELAEIVGISESYIRSIETTPTNVAIPTARLLAAALDMTLDDITEANRKHPAA
jgi:DNA-binding XRE family transcriptional regulator